MILNRFAWALPAHHCFKGQGPTKSHSLFKTNTCLPALTLDVEVCEKLGWARGVVASPHLGLSTSWRDATRLYSDITPYTPRSTWRHRRGVGFSTQNISLGNGMLNDRIETGKFCIVVESRQRQLRQKPTAMDMAP
jgi:hypothetical protein